MERHGVSLQVAVPRPLYSAVRGGRGQDGLLRQPSGAGYIRYRVAVSRTEKTHPWTPKNKGRASSLGAPRARPRAASSFR